jgi:hypothetical protein
LSCATRNNFTFDHPGDYSNNFPLRIRAWIAINAWGFANHFCHFIYNPAATAITRHSHNLHALSLPDHCGYEPTGVSAPAQLFLNISTRPILSPLTPINIMLPPLPRLSDYDVSPQNGFLPDEIPLDVLPDVYYQPWETVVRNSQSLILAKRLRRIIDALPVLETHLLLTEAEWRRAYSILGFIAHGYIWGGEKPVDVRFQHHISSISVSQIRD